MAVTLSLRLNAASARSTIVQALSNRSPPGLQQQPAQFDEQHNAQDHNRQVRRCLVSGEVDLPNE